MNSEIERRISRFLYWSNVKKDNPMLYKQITERVYYYDAHSELECRIQRHLLKSILECRDKKLFQIAVNPPFSFDINAHGAPPENLPLLNEFLFNEDALLILLSCKNLNPNHCSSHCLLPLRLACRRIDGCVIYRLFEAGADINYAGNYRTTVLEEELSSSDVYNSFKLLVCGAICSDEVFSRLMPAALRQLDSSDVEMLRELPHTFVGALSVCVMPHVQSLIVSLHLVASQQRIGCLDGILDPISVSESGKAINKERIRLAIPKIFLMLTALQELQLTVPNLIEIMDYCCIYAKFLTHYTKWRMACVVRHN